jgi:CubicO group peptidase (beta-lactamase class C family)
MHSQHIPALSALVFKGETILFETTLGQASIAQNIPLAPNQPFLLASISKTVTATALMQLYEAGKFALDDPINAYLPFPVRIPDYRQDITFRMLLTHTAALADGPALDDQYYNGKDSPVALRNFLQSYLTANGQYYDDYENFYGYAPGEDYSYSNTGYALIGLLVETISGQNFATYTQQNIFRPLGMSNTAWHLRDISGRIVQPYNYTRGQYRAIPHYTFTDYPNGGLRSTARDMHRFLSSFTNGGLLSAASIRQMTTPQIPAIDREVGLGMFIMNRRLGLWGHDGGEKGAATIMAFNPSTGVGAIILANQGEAELDDMLADAYRFGLGLSGG